MDRGALLGAYMDLDWHPGREPTSRSWEETVPEVERAIRQVRDDLRALEDREGWEEIDRGDESRVCILDKVWWVFAWPDAAPSRPKSDAIVDEALDAAP